MFIASQLEKTRQDLTSAEEVLKQFEQTYKIIALDAQTRATVEATAGIEGQIRAREVQLGVQQRLMTGASREVYLLQEELQALRVQLARLQNGLPSPRPVADHQVVEDQAWLSFDQAPDIKLRYARLQREALVQNKLFTLLAEQLEQAKIEEARDGTAFQILDRALPPERKLKPRRSTTVILATVVSAFVGIMLAFLREYADATIRTKEQVERHVGLPLLVAVPASGPPQHSLLHCPLTPGLADALAIPESWPHVIQSTTFTNLHLMAAGTVTPATYAALESPALDTLLTRSKETYDLILCAAPPALGVTDAAVLGSKVDATCLVLTCGVSPLDTVLEAKSTLEAVQANMIGAILLGKI